MKVFNGKVIATKMAKTATVSVERFVTHPLYGKRLKRTRKYQVHDEQGVKVGDRVQFVACKPISKTKRWTLLPIKQIKEQVEVKPVKEVKKRVTRKAAK